jgi:hypothetical protein
LVYCYFIIFYFHPFSYRLSHSVNTLFRGQDPTRKDSNATLANRLSKMVPRKSRGFETRVTDNPKFQAPIPLYPEPDEIEAEVDKVKVKLRRNPVQTTYPIYDKTYTPPGRCIRLKVIAETALSSPQGKRMNLGFLPYLDQKYHITIDISASKQLYNSGTVSLVLSLGNTTTSTKDRYT